MNINKHCCTFTVYNQKGFRKSANDDTFMHVGKKTQPGVLGQLGIPKDPSGILYWILYGHY